MIVAVDLENGIGFDNKLPWKFSKDMIFFKEKTIGNKNNAIVMGRNTYESIRKPLPDRVNIVISKTMTKFPEGIINYNDPYEITKLTNFDEIWIIGGSQIYNYFLSKSDILNEIYITKINKKYNCDTFFPKLHDDFIKSENKIVMDLDKKSNEKAILNFGIYKSK